METGHASGVGIHVAVEKFPFTFDTLNYDQLTITVEAIVMTMLLSARDKLHQVPGKTPLFCCSLVTGGADQAILCAY